MTLTEHPPVIAPRRSPVGGAAWVEIGAALFLLALTVPWQPRGEMAIGPIDFSWMLLVHHAFATGMQFGRQVMIPQGPLAFIGTDVYDPRTYPLLIAARVLIALVAFWSLRELGRRFIGSWRVELVWLLAVILFMGASPDCFYADCVFLLLLNYFAVHERRLGASGAAMLVLLAAASLIKVNQAMYACIGVAVLTADGLLQRRARWILPGGIYLVSLTVFYLAARQSPASIGEFLWGWWQVVYGHGQSVGLAGPMLDPIGFLIIITGAIAVIGIAEWKARRRVAICPVLGIAGALLLLYKHSFLRQDLFHVSMGPMSALVLLLLYLPVGWSQTAPSWRISMSAMTGLAAILVWAILARYNNAGLVDFAAEELRRCGRNAVAAVDHFTDPDRLARQWQAGRQALREARPLRRSAIVGTVDVYPHRQDIIFAYDLPYTPRPACSSFIANIPALSGLDADHLASPDAAQTILFDIDPVDEKYPSCLDAASWPQLLARYDLIDSSGALLVLRRTSESRRIVYSPLATQTPRFDETITAPVVTDGMVWVQIRFHKRMLGNAIAAAWKPAMLDITVDTADSTKHTYRLLPDLAGAGFLLSPLIEDRLEFAGLYPDSSRAFPAGKTVRRIKIGISGGWRAAAFDPRFTVTFERLRIMPMR